MFVPHSNRAPFILGLKVTNGFINLDIYKIYRLYIEADDLSVDNLNTFYQSDNEIK